MLWNASTASGRDATITFDLFLKVCFFHKFLYFLYLSEYLPWMFIIHRPLTEEQLAAVTHHTSWCFWPFCCRTWWVIVSTVGRLRCQSFPGFAATTRKNPICLMTGALVTGTCLLWGRSVGSSCLHLELVSLSTPSILPKPRSACWCDQLCGNIKCCNSVSAKNTKSVN